jgi:hypothetical protein
MDGAKAEGFRFERIAEGPDAPVVGVRDSVGYRDEIYLAGFSDSCTAIRRKRFSLQTTSVTTSVRTGGNSCPQPN